MTPEQAVTGLIALIGSGGVTSLGVAWLAYRTAATKGRPAAEAPVITITGNTTGSGEGRSAEPSSIALQTIATHLCRIAAILELEADEKWDGKNFRDLVSDRMSRLQIDDVKAAAGAYSTERR